MEPALLDFAAAGVSQDNQPAPEGDEKVTMPMPNDDPILRKKTLKLGEVDEDEDDDKVGKFISFFVECFW